MQRKTKKPITKEEFIIKANKVHNYKYDYSKFIYINCKSKGIIICNEHGEFWKTPDNHINAKRGCRNCPTERFIKEQIKFFAHFLQISKNKHGDKYNYSKVKYVNLKTKVIIICQEHGPFLQAPSKHMLGQGCNPCGRIVSGNKQKKSLQQFINQANIKHKNKYDYSKFIYVNANTKGIIICPIHGEFKQSPSIHFKCGCYDCGRDICAEKFKKSLNIFIKEANETHDYFYIYDKFIYINDITKGIIICPKHGSFSQRPNDHRHGTGCPSCINKNEATSKKFIEKLLNITIQNKVRIYTDTSWIYPDFRFIVNAQEYIIEYNGLQHYEATTFYGGTKENAEEVFHKQQLRDQWLRNYCKENNIILIEIDGRKYVGENIKIYLTEIFKGLQLI